MDTSTLLAILRNPYSAPVWQRKDARLRADELIEQHLAIWSDKAKGKQSSCKPCPTCGESKCE